MSSVIKRLDDSKQEIKEIKKILADPESSSYRDIVEQELAFETRIHDRLTAVIGDWPKRR